MGGKFGAILSARSIMNPGPETKMLGRPVITTGRISTEDGSLANRSMASDAGDFNAAVLRLVFAIEVDNHAG